MDVLVGTRVVRGRDWTWGEQDGGEGHVGTVAEVLRADRGGLVDGGCPGPCVVTVQWDCGNRCRYRCGLGDSYDLRVIDSAPAGIKHHRVVCNICGLQLTGMRWNCIKCYDYDLCTFCYMSGEHELDHEFDRMDTPRLRIRVPTRASSKKKEARGIYQHAEVIPGRDWITTSTNQDMFIYGEVVAILGSNGDNSRGFAEVKWSESQHTSTHRVGSEGKVELRCVEPSCVSYYYPDHLPDLGTPVDEDEVVQSGDISSGDYVKVELDPEVFRAMHEGNEETGWDDLMMEVLGVAGQVQRVFSSGSLRVKFSRLHVWTICAEAVVKADIPHFSVGDKVSVSISEDRLAQLVKKQKEFGEVFSMFYGEICRVYEISCSGIVIVTSKQKQWSFPSLFLVPQNDLSSLPWSNPLPSADNPQALKNYLKQHPNEVNRKVGGRTALHCAAVTADSALIKLLLEFGANTEIGDLKRYRALHYSILVGSTEATEVLVGAGADVNAKGYNGNTPLILAANGGHTSIARLLLGHPNINIHEVDMDGNTALHEAVLSQHLQVISLLLEAGADPSLVNFRLYNAFIEAARIGLTAAVEQMILQNPENSKITNEYRYNLLHTGALIGRKDIVSLAIDKGGISVDSREDTGQTALHVAVQEGHFPVIEQLIDYGADVNARDNNGLTSLHFIIMCRDYFDIPSEACPQIKKLHEALMGKLSDNVNKLYSPVSLLVYFLKKGADIHIENAAGQSPLKMLPYLANLMTVLVENDQLLTDRSTFSSKDGIFAMLGSDRPFMVSKIVDVTSMDQYTGRQGSGFGKVRGSYGEPTPRIGSRDASGLDGQVTSISRTLYPDNQAESQGSNGHYGQGSNGHYYQGSSVHYGHGSDGHYHQGSSRYYGQGSDYSHGSNRRYGQQHYGAFYSDSSSTSGSHSDSASYSAVSPSTKQYSSYGQRSYTTSRESHNAKKASVQSTSTCFLCDSPGNVRFQPCGHSDMCSQCAARAKKCPTCRGSVQGYERI